MHVLYPFGKTVQKITPHGTIILDFISRTTSYPFEGHPEIPFSFEILSGNTVFMRVRGGSEIAGTQPLHAGLLKTEICVGSELPD